MSSRSDRRSRRIVPTAPAADHAIVSMADYVNTNPTRIRRIVNYFQRLRQQRLDAQSNIVNAFIDAPMDQGPTNVQTRNRRTNNPPNNGTRRVVPTYQQRYIDPPSPMVVVSPHSPEGYTGPMEYIDVKKDEDGCSICMGKVVLPDCISCINNHRIHYSCYVKWFKKQKKAKRHVTCPLCKSEEFKYCSPIIEKNVIKAKSTKVTTIGSKRPRTAITGNSSGGRRTRKHRNKRR